MSALPNNNLNIQLEKLGSSQGYSDLNTNKSMSASRDFEPQATARQPEIAAEFDGLFKNIEELAGQVSLLEDRLTPALSPNASTSQTGNTAAPDAPLAPLAMALRDLKRRVATIGAQLAGVIDRIELPR